MGSPELRCYPRQQYNVRSHPRTGILFVVSCLGLCRSTWPTYSSGRLMLTKKRECGVQAQYFLVCLVTCIPAKFLKWWCWLYRMKFSCFRNFLPGIFLHHPARHAPRVSQRWHCTGRSQPKSTTYLVQQYHVCCRCCCCCWWTRIISSIQCSAWSQDGLQQLWMEWKINSGG